MKTSNIILSSYLFLVILFLCTFLIPSNDKKWHSKDFETYETKIPQIKHLKIKPGVYVAVHSDKEYRLTGLIEKETKKATLKYQIKGDTLTIFPFDTLHNFFCSYNLYVKTLKGIETDNASCDVTLKQDSIDLKGLNNSHITISGPISNIRLSLLENSNSEIRNVHLNSLTSNLNKSKLLSGALISQATITMQDSSKVSLHKVKELTLTSDTTSTFGYW
jgi:hypothetical protein